MKKMSVMVSLLVGMMILVFTVEPCLSKWMITPESTEEFTGCRYRTSVVTGTVASGDVKIYNCLYNVNNQHAYWKVAVGNPLVDGDWYNWNTEVRRAINEFTMPSGPNIACDPSTKDPPEGYKGVVTGNGIISGPFMLTPTGAGGGVWYGTWKIIYNPDGSWVQTVEAQGYGGLIEGMTLYSSITQPAGFASNCKCCPAGTVVIPATANPVPFSGWILTPGGLKK